MTKKIAYPKRAIYKDIDNYNGSTATTSLGNYVMHTCARENETLIRIVGNILR